MSADKLICLFGQTENNDINNLIKDNTSMNFYKLNINRTIDDVTYTQHENALKGKTIMKFFCVVDPNYPNIPDDYIETLFSIKKIKDEHFGYIIIDDKNLSIEGRNKISNEFDTDFFLSDKDIIEKIKKSIPKNGVNSEDVFSNLVNGIRKESLESLTKVLQKQVANFISTKIDKFREEYQFYLNSNIHNDDRSRDDKFVSDFIINTKNELQKYAYYTNPKIKGDENEYKKNLYLNYSEKIIKKNHSIIRHNFGLLNNKDSSSDDIEISKIQSEIGLLNDRDETLSKNKNKSSENSKTSRDKNTKVIIFFLLICICVCVIILQIVRSFYRWKRK